jgi:hypothetical protein
MKGQGGGVHQWNNLWFRWCLNTKYTQILWCLMVPRRKLNDVMETGFHFWKWKRVSRKRVSRKHVSVSTFRFPLCRCLQPTDMFFLLFFFLADFSYVGFVLVGNVLDIQR